MSTNWEEIRKRHKHYSMPVPDETGPARIFEILAGLGLTGIENEGLVRLVQPAEANTGFIFLVTATELFGEDPMQREELEFAQRRGTSKSWQTVALDHFSRKVAMWQEVDVDFFGQHAYLLVVDLDGWLNKPGNREVALRLFHDVRGVRKIVCGPKDLTSILVNPFGAPRASEKLAQFDVQRMDPHSFEPPVRDFVTTVTHPFVQVANTEVWLQQLVDHPETERVAALANTLVRRVMGAEYELYASRLEVILDRNGRRMPMPWFMLGMGEQYALSFCVFAALAFEDTSKPASQQWLGLTDAMNYLDLSHYVLALDVLRDFVIATGANVYLRTNKENYRELAKGKLEKAVACRLAMTG